MPLTGALNALLNKGESTSLYCDVFACRCLTLLVFFGIVQEFQNRVHSFCACADNQACNEGIESACVGDAQGLQDSEPRSIRDT
jgi:hypothetical protein